MSFIKRHWFNILMILFAFTCISITLLAAFAPKVDKQERGFIPCTKELSAKLVNCDSNAWCVVKAIIANSGCDSKVIAKGFKLWIKGEQKTPWSNYFFNPDLSLLENDLNEHSEMFYKENPNYIEDFKQLKQEHQKLEELNSNDKTEK